jgi:hypothetical protein
MKKQYFQLTLFSYIAALLYLAITTPIAPHEAKLLYEAEGIASYLMRLGENLPIGFLGIRLFSLMFGVFSIILFYQLSVIYLNKKDEVYFATLIFILLPAIVTATILANVAVLALFCVLLFVLLYEKGYTHFLPLVMLALFFVHDASVVFYVAVLLYAIAYRESRLAFWASGFVLASIYFSKGIEIGGGPVGHFAEAFGLYATIFSPLLFLYFFYTMYRILLKEEKSLIWYISFIAFAFSLLLSIRQRVYITDFAPYVMIAVIPMVDFFNRTIGVRLPEHRKWYRYGLRVVLSFLMLSFFLILSHKALFLFWENPKKHFAYRIYQPYFLAKELKENGIECYDGVEQYQLRYYGLTPCAK